MCRRGVHQTAGRAMRPPSTLAVTGCSNFLLVTLLCAGILSALTKPADCAARLALDVTAIGGGGSGSQRHDEFWRRSLLQTSGATPDLTGQPPAISSAVDYRQPIFSDAALAENATLAPQAPPRISSPVRPVNSQPTQVLLLHLLKCQENRCSAKLTWSV